MINIYIIEYLVWDAILNFLLMSSLKFPRPVWIQYPFYICSILIFFFVGHISIFIFFLMCPQYLFHYILLYCDGTFCSLSPYWYSETKGVFCTLYTYAQYFNLPQCFVNDHFLKGLVFLYGSRQNAGVGFAEDDCTSFSHNLAILLVLHRLLSLELEEGNTDSDKNMNWPLTPTSSSSTFP